MSELKNITFHRGKIKHSFCNVKQEILILNTVIKAYINVKHSKVQELKSSRDTEE